ncbi:hypothetical protein [Anaerorhabdus sp.]|uniref:hypothetical protein n=1 Tax=Anaerorhabdus sp. TaxID=1872524 RepID=UPI002FC8547C
MKNITLSELLNHTDMYVDVQIVNSTKGNLVMNGTTAQCLFNYECEPWLVETISTQNEVMVIEVVQYDQTKNEFVLEEK